MVKYRIVYKFYFKLKILDIFEVDFVNVVKFKDLFVDEELWVRFEELEEREELLGEFDRYLMVNYFFERICFYIYFFIDFCFY